MKALFIGGTGNISSAVSQLAVDRGIDLFHLNRGNLQPPSPKITTLVADISDARSVATALGNHTWDVVVDWIAFKEADVQRDIRLFDGKTRQFIFISSASCYQKPSPSPVITEETPLANPFWQYSRDKIACEERLFRAFRETGFPATVVRPSHTYRTIIPAVIGGGREFTIVDRIRKGKKIIVHGDGSSLWVLTHADDFATGFLGLVGQEQALGQSFHITSDEVLSWDRIHEILAGAAGGEARIVHIPSDLLATYDENLRGTLLGDKAVSVIFDNSRIRSLVPDFNPSIPFSEGIRRTLAWFDEDPSRTVVNPDTDRMIDSMIRRYERAFAS